MIGMTFGAFVTLLVCGFISAVVLHYGARYRVLAGGDGFMAKWILGWIGAWLGSPVLGHWAFTIAGIYAIPALIGAFIGSFMLTAVAKVVATRLVAAAPVLQAEPARVEFRKTA